MDKHKHSKGTTLLYRLNMIFVKFEEVLLVVMFFVLLGAMVTQVICRYVFLVPTPWAEELSRYLYIWIAYIGGAYATFYWDHIDIDLASSFINRFSKNPDRVKLITEKIAIALTVSFLFFFVNIYGNFLANIWNLGQHSAAMGVNMVLPMSAAYVGSILMIFHGICILFLPKSIIKAPSWEKDQTL